MSGSGFGDLPVVSNGGVSVPPADQTETNQGLINTKYVSPITLKGWKDSYLPTQNLNFLGLRINSLLGTGNRLPQLSPNGTVQDSGVLIDVLARAFFYTTSYVSPFGSNTTALRGRIDLPYQTIQAALSQAQVGDTIVVTTGIYNENLVFPSFIGNHGGNVESYFLNFVLADGAVINGNHTFPTNLNAGILVKIFGRGSMTASGTLFSVGLNSGNAIRIYGAKSLESGGDLFSGCRLDLVENVDMMIAAGYMFAFCENSLSYPSNLIRRIYNVGYMSAGVAIWYGSDGSRPCFDFDRVQLEAPYVVYNPSVSGACNYYSRKIRNSIIFLSQSFGDDYLGRVENIENCEITTNHPTKPIINLSRPAGVTDGVGYYFLRMRNTKLKTTNSSQLAVASSDNKNVLVSYSETNGVLGTGLLNDGIMVQENLNENLI